MQEPSDSADVFEEVREASHELILQTVLNAPGVHDQGTSALCLFAHSLYVRG